MRSARRQCARLARPGSARRFRRRCLVAPCARVLTGRPNARVPRLPFRPGHTISYTHTLGGAPAGTLDIEYVIADGGRSISGLAVNSGGVLSCSLRRIGGFFD